MRKSDKRALTLRTAWPDFKTYIFLIVWDFWDFVGFLDFLGLFLSGLQDPCARVTRGLAVLFDVSKNLTLSTSPLNYSETVCQVQLD